MAILPPEYRAPRIAELDAQIRAQAEEDQNRPRPKRKSKPRGRSTPPLPAAVRKETTRFARGLNRRYGQPLRADPKLRDRVARLLRSLLLPRPSRRGRPGFDSVTRAIALLKRFRRQHPGEKPEERWRSICLEVIPNYAGMTKLQQGDARVKLIARVKDRIKKRKRRARRSARGIRPAEILPLPNPA